MADVFISFIHEEQAIAQAVQAMLRSQLMRNFEVFMSGDESLVRAGENWLDRIAGELRDARVLILLLSPRSVVRPWVNFEAGAAWLAGKHVIPVCYGGLTQDALPKPYSDLQAVTLPEGAYYLVKSVFDLLTEGREAKDLFMRGIFIPIPRSMYTDKDLIRLQHELAKLAAGTA